MKFFNLLKKEVRELLNAQTIIGMIGSLILLIAMGQFMSGAMENAIKEPEALSICDMDKTEFTAKVLGSLKTSGYNVKEVEISGGNIADIMHSQDLEGLVIIPEGFTKSVLEDRKTASLQCVSVMKSTSMLGSIGNAKASDMASNVAKTSKDIMLAEIYKITGDEMAQMENPVSFDEITVVGDKSAKISAEALLSFSSSQGMIVPMVIFVLALYASQMIITAISTEKIDKTLETLMTAPVSRLSVLGAKMLAATIVALLNAVVYMVGFGGMMNGMTGGMMDEVTSMAGDAASSSAALAQLGLILSPSNYLFLGLQMFITLLIALAISLCLGAMVNDAKSTQTVILPMMFAIMAPFMITMFVNINELSTLPRIIMYLIPFTHTYLAIDNLIFGNTALYWGGLVYQIIFFAVCMFLAVKLFTSDKLFTASLSFGKKKKQM